MKHNIQTAASPTPLTARQRGDFQTPEALARQVWAMCSAPYDVVIEPTFGLGAFLTAMPDEVNADVVGWEINEDYYQFTHSQLVAQRPAQNLQLMWGDVFCASASDLNLSSAAAVLVIGNPPWITNAEQGVLGGRNTGRKSNLKALPGFEAMTGKANFDISEAIILHFVQLLRGRCKSVQFALLTKFSVVKNLLAFLTPDAQVGDFEFYKIDAAKHFGASVHAGLLKFKLGHDIASRHQCAIYDAIGGHKIGTLGLVGKQLIYDLQAYQTNSFVSSETRHHYVWRQGIKHDVSKIMELAYTPGGWQNGLGETVDIEAEALYDLYKSSDLYNGHKSRFVIPIYQADLKDSLDDLPQKFPKLYRYLIRHEAAFANRKSSIYRNKPQFSVFGIGDYSHATYKVAISGFYPQPVFRLLEPTCRPVIVDDTAYMIATDDYEEAVYLLAVLSLDCVRDLLLAISDAGDKRRFSKSVLEQVFIPPISECPSSLRTAITEAWSKDRKLSPATLAPLQAWRRAYKPL